MPLPMVTVLLVVAAIVWRRGAHRIATIMAIASLLLVYVLSLYPTAHFLVEPLEFHYPKYAEQPVDAVIVLGGYHRSDERLPITSLLSETSLMRLSEGIRIYRANPGAKLWLSGYHARDEISQAEAMAKVAKAFFVPDSDIVLQPQAKDTAEEALAWSTLMSDKRVALVTSAMHMPRAMYLFRQYDLEPIAAPTAYRSGGTREMTWNDCLPSANALHIVELAWHEYLGLVWARLQSYLPVSGQLPSSDSDLQSSGWTIPDNYSVKKEHHEV